MNEIQVAWRILGRTDLLAKPIKGSIVGHHGR